MRRLREKIRVHVLAGAPPLSVPHRILFAGSIVVLAFICQHWRLLKAHEFFLVGVAYGWCIMLGRRIWWLKQKEKMAASSAESTSQNSASSDSWSSSSSHGGVR